MKNKQFTQSDVGSAPRPKVTERVIERPSEPMLIELHRKQDKLIIVTANVIFFLAICLAFFTFSDTGSSIMTPDTGMSIAGIMVLISFAIYGYGRFMMWWHNE